MIDKIKKECADFKHIQWLAGHIDFYQANEKGSMVLKELEKYGCNVYTYPHEAKKAYQNFTNELCNNPYNYMSGFQSIYEKWGIYASVLDGYLLSIDSDIKIPIGFLKEIINSEAGENIENVQQKAATMLNDCLNHYKKECYNNKTRQ